MNNETIKFNQKKIVMLAVRPCMPKLMYGMLTVYFQNSLLMHESSILYV